MHINFLALLVAAVVGLVVGFVWYHPKVLGSAWMKAAGITEESIKQSKGPNMALLFLLTFVFAFMLAISLNSIVIHQMGVFSMLAPGSFDPGAKVEVMLNGQVQDYMHNFRTFRHGALHGFIAGLFIAMPILATNALYERKGFKYIAINSGYWMITLMIMGGIICGWE